MNPFTIIIPARLASSRLPEKLLKLIGNQSVLEHTYLAAKSSAATRVVIAADDPCISDMAKSFGAEVIMTKKDHESGTDRLAECAQLLGLNDDEIIVNLQGDEPFMPAHLMNLCADRLANDNDAVVSTLAVKMHEMAEINNPNAVKVVLNQREHALYFSRAAIPFDRDASITNPADYYLHHLGIYGYRAGFLQHYQKLSPSKLEQVEKLEQLRILDYGYSINVGVVNEKPPKGIDTEADLIAARVHYEKTTLKNKSR